MSRPLRAFRALSSVVFAGTLAYFWACSSGGSGTTGPNPSGIDAVDSITLALDSTEVLVGDTLRLSAVPRDTHGNAVSGLQLQWESSDTLVVTVTADGLVSVVDVGEADVGVSAVGVSSSAALPAGVIARARGGRNARSNSRVFGVPKLVITPGDTSVPVHSSFTYTATVTDISNRALRHAHPVQWNSSATSVATIDVAGQASALSSGTTTIAAALTIGNRGLTTFEKYTKSVTLRVAGCDALLDVASWDAGVGSTYHVTSDLAGVNWLIDQKSSGTAHLVRVVRLGDSSVWIGRPEGNATVNNHADFTGHPEAAGSEIGDGAMDTHLPLVTLTAHALLSKGGCVYTVKYLDGLSYKKTAGSQSATQTTILGIAFAGAVLHPEEGRPSGGWVLTRTDTVPAIGPDFTPLPLDYYGPSTLMGSSLLGIAPDKTLGQAVFNWAIFEHVP